MKVSQRSLCQGKDLVVLWMRELRFIDLIKFFLKKITLIPSKI